MKIALTKIASQIAKSLSLKHCRHIAYKMITHNGFKMIIGLCTEPDCYSPQEFSVHTFIQALYVPFPAEDLSLGERIVSWDRTDLEGALSLIQECYERLPSDSISTVIEMLNTHQLSYYGSICNKYEFLAYSYIAINHYDYATIYLNKIVAFEKDKNREWYEDQIIRAKSLLNLIESNNWKQIRELLLTWQKETMASLKLLE